MSVTSTPKGSDLELDALEKIAREAARIPTLGEYREPAVRKFDTVALANLSDALTPTAILSLISAARKGQGEWRGIESAPKDDPILASISGKVWFQANWDEDDGEWVTFNRYLESDPHQPRRKFEPTIYMPLPPPPELGE